MALSVIHDHSQPLFKTGTQTRCDVHGKLIGTSFDFPPFPPLERTIWSVGAFFDQEAHGRYVAHYLLPRQHYGNLEVPKSTYFAVFFAGSVGGALNSSP
jgi:hypothetical protein